MQDRPIEDDFRRSDLKPLVTVEDLAEQIKISPQTIRRWVREGKIPAIRLSFHDIRFFPDKIARWLRDREFRGR